MTKSDVAFQAFLNILAQKDLPGEAIAEHLRHRDLTAAVRAGGLLAFNGLIIAAITQLLTSVGSAGSGASAVMGNIVLLGFLSCFFACVMALVSMLVAGDYRGGEGADVASFNIGEYRRILERKHALIVASLAATIIGSVLSLLFFVSVILRSFFGFTV
jgi:hypothetical protein